MEIIVSEDRLRGEGPDRVQFVNAEFNRAYAAHEVRRAKLFADLEMFWGDQIPTLAKTHASAQGRELVVYNIAQRKVVGLVGSLLQNNFNITYLSKDGRQTSLIYSLQDMLEVDKNHSNWDYNFMMYLIYGCISEGIMEMVEFQDEENPIGSIGFSVCSPGSVIIDPNWTSGMSKDIQFDFKYHYLTAKQIISMFPEAKDRIKDALRRQLRNGGYYQERFYDTTRDNASSKGSSYQVIEYNYLDEQPAVLEVDFATGLVLPSTDNTEYKRAWLSANGSDGASVQEITYNRKLLKSVIICPELQGDLPLEDKPHKFQCGRTVKFPWSPMRINGEPKGIVALVRDMQLTMNKRQNNINQILESGANGSAFISEGLVDGDEKLKKLIQQNWTNPQFKAWVPEGKIETGKSYILPLPRGEVPASMFQQIARLYDDMDRILPVNAASDGIAQSASESGVLFGLKSQAVVIAQTTIVRAIQNALTEMGAAYAIAAKHKYAGVERSFVKQDGTVIKINEIVPLDNGDIAIKNDIASLQAVDTLVKMGPDSPNSRFERRTMALDVLQRINPQILPEVYVNVAGELVNSIDWADSAGNGIKDAVDRAIKKAKMEAEAALAPPSPPTAPPGAAPIPQQMPIPGLEALMGVGNGLQASPRHNAATQTPIPGLEALM